MIPTRCRSCLALTVAMAGVSAVLAAAPLAPDAILPELRSFQQTAGVLYVAAHPDDENTRLITYLARGRGYRTAYLSVTRGDGGQNLLSGDLRERLGVARTQELLAARRLDGGRQFFTRAVDFGYSKDAAETLRIWDRDAVLGDVVRVIRTFRPDVIVTRFSPVPGRTHGHHTASAMLALEAFELAGDPDAYPEQLDQLEPWQPKRILENGRSWGGGNPADDDLQIRIDGEDPASGMSFGEIAGRSRAMHKTQGFGNFGGGGGGPRTESFQLLAGEPATNDIMDGVAATWNRFPRGGEIDRLVDAVMENFEPGAPAASVPELLEIRRRVQALPTGPLIKEKLRQLDHIVQSCLGLEVETLAASAHAVPGETIELQHNVTLGADFPVTWTGLRYPGSGRQFDLNNRMLVAGRTSHLDSTQSLPETTPPTQPYWLQQDGTLGMFVVAEPALIGTPENPPVFPVEFVFEVEGERLVIANEPVEATDAPVPPELRRRLQVIPPASVGFAYDVALFGPGETRPVVVEVTAHRAEATGFVAIDAPEGWNVSPESQEIVPGADALKTRYTFTITAPAKPATARLTASVTIDGRRYDNQYVEINYDHIPAQLLQPPARLKAVCFDLAIRGRNVGYLPGAGDDVPASLEQMGYTVTLLEVADLAPEKLSAFDAVVFGVRAFNVHDDLRARMPVLFEFVRQGGNLVVQYNTARGLSSEGLAPYPLELSGDRVTDENAVVTFLAADHPALNTPNQIGPADFDDWVQERGLYFPDQWDEEHFTALLACHDPGEAPMHGSLLVAPHGDGWFVYTGLSFFRQLPAGVPGAYRLFANLVSLGK